MERRLCAHVCRTRHETAAQACEWMRQWQGADFEVPSLRAAPSDEEKGHPKPALLTDEANPAASTANQHSHFPPPVTIANPTLPGARGLGGDYSRAPAMRASCCLPRGTLSEVHTRTQASAFMVGPKAFEAAAALVESEAPAKPDLRAGENPAGKRRLSPGRACTGSMWRGNEMCDDPPFFCPPYSPPSRPLFLQNATAAALPRPRRLNWKYDTELCRFCPLDIAPVPLLTSKT